MDNKYINISKKLKVLSDPKRLEIVDMLSCEELCACEILEKFDISQPTLSSDMKKLEDANIIKSRKEGKNVFYIVNKPSTSSIFVISLSNFSTKISWRFEAGSVLTNKTLDPLSHKFTAVAQALEVFPTPPFPAKNNFFA